MFLAQPSAASPDLAALLLDTARRSSGNARLFIMAATWLATHGAYVDEVKLATLIAEQLELPFKPVMGLLLDQARSLPGSCGVNFDAPIARCEPAAVARPLFEVERRNPTLWQLAQRDATPISRKWNLWARPFQPKHDAIRPDAWIRMQNPAFDAGR